MPYDPIVHRRSLWLIAAGVVGLAATALLMWAIEYTESPSWPVAAIVVLATLGLAIGPWAILAHRSLDGDHRARRMLGRVLVIAAIIAAAGVTMAITVQGDPDAATNVAMTALLVAGVLAFGGAVVGPWLLLVARTVARERAARIRAEQHAAMATHLHDSVLQALTLIQKRTDDPETVARLARSTERELRAYLFDPPAAQQDDFATALRATAAETEDRFAVSIEVVTVGTCRLDELAHAVHAAAGEALANAGRHAQSPRISIFTEVNHNEILALIRDWGRGFDPATIAPDRRGITHSIEGRMRQSGGTATIRSQPGQGTEVELHMPRAGTP